MSNPKEIGITGVKLSVLSADEILSFASSSIESGKQVLISSGNVHAFNIASREEWYSKFLNDADVVRLDGFGLRLGAGILGHETPARSTWADFGWELARHSEEKGHSIFFFGAKPGIAEKAAKKLQDEYPELKIAGKQHGYIDLAEDSEDTADLVEKINKSGADILLIGLGMPKQERWLIANRKKLKVRVIFTGGAVFDYLSGDAKRAPQWMLDHGLEWLYRLKCEPGRMWERYIIGNPAFLFRVIKQRLASLGRSEWQKVLYWFLIISAFILLYGIQGNRQEAHIRTKSAILWMVDRWSGSGGDLSHGWIIPIVSLFVVLKKFKLFRAAEKQTSYWGLVVIVLSLLLHWFGMKTQLTRVSLLSMIGLIWGIPFYLYGTQVARLLVFPCAYLMFCIPLSFLNNVTVPLRIFASKASVFMLNGIGVETVRSGTMVYSSAAGGFNFDIADPCSGLRSLLAMCALTAVYAYLTQKTLVRKWSLFFSAIPLAIVGNIARIFTIALAALFFGQAMAMKLYHDYSGLIVFFVSVVLMVGLGRIISCDMSGKLEEWKKIKKDNTAS